MEVSKEWIKEEIDRRCDRFKLWYENAEIKEKSYYYGLYKAMQELSQDIYERENRRY